MTIIQDPDLRGVIGSAPAPRGSSVLARDGNYSILYGYRVQVFNSNLPNAKSEAYARAEAIRRVAPTLSSYITFRAPFWRLTVGNFTSQEEARAARARLMVALPAWGRESYVVREKVRILNYTEPPCLRRIASPIRRHSPSSLRAKRLPKPLCATTTTRYSACWAKIPSVRAW